MDRRRGRLPLPPPGTPRPPPRARSPRLSDARLFRDATSAGLTDISIPVPPQAKYGNRWATVAEEMPGRTGQQCAQRWRHKVNPNIRKDKWTDDEDAKVRPQHKFPAIGRNRAYALANSADFVVERDDAAFSR